jgi:hypothetical protein
MDANHFDDLLRSLIQTPSRRAIGRVVVGGVAGVALGRLRPRPAMAGAGCFKGRKKCRGDSQCCSLKCHHGRCHGKRRR